MADNEGVPQPEPEPQPVEHSTADYASWKPPEKQRSPHVRKLGIGLAVLAVLVVLGAGAYWFMSKRGDKPAPAGTTSETQETSQLAPAAGEITTKTKHYVSQNFQLEFDYPEDWTAGEDTAEGLSLLSPDIKMVDTDGKAVVGQIAFTIQPSIQKVPGIEGNGAKASRNSEKINYTSPTPAQRGSTYVSFARFADSQSPNALDGVFITGDLGYQKDQGVPASDIAKVNPVIYYTFYLCPDSGCVEVSGVYGIGVATWDNKAISEPLLNMLKSLKIN